eukprot:scaffold148468_cov41-Tisochrysis_lutea.AAC.1
MWQPSAVSGESGSVMKHANSLIDCSEESWTTHRLGATWVNALAFTGGCPGTKHWKDVAVGSGAVEGPRYPIEASRLARPLHKILLERVPRRSKVLRVARTFNPIYL